MKISVIVPCYNQAQYLDECLQSVLDQTYTDWECIIVNDGSTDNTEEIAKRWVEKDGRFQYFFQENKGVSAARNNGVRHAAGQYILPLDGDDRLHKEILEKFLAVFTGNSKVGVVYSKVQYFGDLTEEMPLKVYDKTKLLLANSIICTAMYAREDFETIGGYDELMLHGYEDWEFWIRFVHYIDKEVVQIPETLFYYRIKSGSRNDVVVNDDAAYNKAFNYFYTKHLDLYRKVFGHPFSIIQRKMEWEEKYSRLEQNKFYKTFQRANGLLKKIKK